MNTYFAPAERASAETLQQLTRYTETDPVINGLLALSDGMLAILNEQRQVVSLNRSLLDALGLSDSREAIGLRPGEMIRCAHAHDEEGGCGTGRVCSSCGAAIAIVSCLAGNEPTERKCVVTLEKDGKQADVCFLVRCKPLEYNGHKLLILFLHDISSEEKRIAIENLFFHDINNVLTILMGVCEFLHLADTDEMNNGIELLHKQILRLHREVRLQKLMLSDGDNTGQLYVGQIDAEQLLNGLKAAMEKHAAAFSRSIELSATPFCFVSDSVLVERVLQNMVLNALEASQPGECVRLAASEQSDKVLFSVWNGAYIPENMQPRIFQMHFSTKSARGRGFGTHSIKFLGEDVLGGRVRFTSNQTQGTTFFLELPRTR